MGLSLQAWVPPQKKEKRKSKRKISDKETTPGAAVGKEEHAESLLGHEKTHQYWFFKRCDCKQYFLMPTHLAKFTDSMGLVWFGLVSLFNVISTGTGYFIHPCKNSKLYYQTDSKRVRGLILFPGINLKVIVIESLEFELSFKDVAAL